MLEKILSKFKKKENITAICTWKIVYNSALNNKYQKESLDKNFPEQLKKCSSCDGYSTYFGCYHGGHK
jgi:hypothetical protein